MRLIYILLLVTTFALILSTISIQASFISIAIFSILVAVVIAYKKNSRAWLFASIASSLWASEELLWAYFRFTNTANIVLTDILYYLGAALWFIALIKMKPKLSASRNAIFAIPLLVLVVWLSWQSWSINGNFSIIVELILFFSSLPLVFAAMQGKAHEGRILWSFGFYIRVIATALLGWVAPLSSSGHLFYLVFGLSYSFILVGIILELSKTRNNLIAIGFSILGLETLVTIVIVLFHKVAVLNSLTSNLIIFSFAYFLLLSVLTLISSDKQKRLGAEIQLRNYSNLLEHILSYKTQELHSNFKLQELEQGLFKITKASFPELTGLKIINDSGKESIFGQTEENSILIKADDEIVGNLYFREDIENLDLLTNIAPLLGNYIKTTLSHFSSQTEAMTDPLTEILNRRGFDSQSKLLLKQAKTYQLPITLVLIDIDHFKLINDQYGHHIGDQVLTTFSSVIKNNIRSFDLFVRWGGEEFLLILYDANIERATMVIDRIYRDLQNTKFKRISKSPSFSAGITGGEIPENLNLDEQLAKADQAMYIAKKTGRNKHVVLN